MARKKQPANQRKPMSARVMELRRAARRGGWAKWIRQGEGEEADEKAMLAGCRFDIKRAQHVVDFYEKYGVLTEGEWAGKLIRLMDWQHNWLCRAFGWIRLDDERDEWLRRFRWLYLEVPKKSGKTPMMATLGNYLLFADAPFRQVNQFVAATTKIQAERLLKHAIRAVKFWDDWQLFAEVKKLEGFSSIHYGDNVWSVLPADETSTDGINGHIIADEVHLWKGYEFFNSLKWALASQAEGIFAGITTAGENMESACRVCHDKTKLINSGHQMQVDWFGTIFAADPEDDPHDESTWRKANPSLGTTKHHPLKLSTFRQDYEEAKNDPTQWPKWLQKRLNIWRTSTDAWLQIEQWDIGKVGRLTKKGAKRKHRRDCYEEFGEESFDWSDLEGVMALDMATVRDTNAVVFTFEHPTDDGALLTLPYYWMPEARAIELQSKVPFRQWSESGLITLTNGDAVDFDYIYRDLLSLVEFFGIRKFYFDPLFQAEWITQKIESGTGATRIEFPQTVLHFSAAMKTAERMILTNKLRHAGHPIFNWQFGHVKAHTNANGDCRPVKQKHGDYRTIDGPVAMIMTIRNWLTDSDDGSYYDDHELEIF